MTLLFVQKLIEPTKVERWAVVNFSARCDIRNLIRDLIKCGSMKGIVGLFSLSFAVFKLDVLATNLFLLTTSSCRT